MKINLKNNDFLFWREPNKTSFQLFLLKPASGDLARQICMAPFFGVALSFSIVEECFLTAEEVSELDFPEPENELTEKTSAQKEHVKLVAEAVEALQEPGFEKVVLARKKVIEKAPEIKAWLLALAEKYPQSCAFVFHTKATGTWMGATPEVLLSRDTNTVSANSLAGTRLATDLGAWGAKEIDEQAIVTESVLKTFADFGVENIQTNGPKTKIAGPVAHLFTEVSGEITAEKNSLDLAKKLHPTPAVGGLPQQKAINFIRERENFDRQFYAGFFGIEEENSARFYVNLRSMQLFKNGLVLYAGGGITAQSNPEAEWEETERKLQTLLHIIEA
jgi:isochorismate synthase